MPKIPETALSLTLTGVTALTPISTTSQTLRALLLLAVGAAAPGCRFLFNNNCPDYEAYPVDLNFSVEKGEICPESPSTATIYSYEDYSLGSAEDSGYSYEDYSLHQCEDDATLVEQAGTLCAYTISCEQWSCCGYGRPYLDDTGTAVTAETTADDAWSRTHPVDAALSDADRAQLAAFWTKNAVSEHSSVAGFHRFALDLLAHGAPPELVRRAGRAADQEITHALDCFTLASAYGGSRTGPAPLALGGSAPVAKTLAELAAWTVRDGVIGETIAAYLAEESRLLASDPEVRRALAVVVRDETDHAALAWETLMWALSVGGEEVRLAVRGVFSSLAHPTSAPERSTPGTIAHGILPAAARDAAVARCIDEVIRPVMASALSRALAA